MTLKYGSMSKLAALKNTDTRTDYQAYDKVSLDGMIFECQPGDYEEYCNIHEEDWDWSYDELVLWYDAWMYVGSC